MKTKRTSISLAALLLLAGIFYTCTAKTNDDIQEKEECVEERKCECDFDDDDFDLSGLNEENCISQWAVELTLKSEITDCPIEDPVVKALVAKHELIFYQSYPGFQTPKLLLLYTLVGHDCSNLCYVRAIIRAFLATGLFEHHIRIFERTFPL